MLVNSSISLGVAEVLILTRAGMSYSIFPSTLRYEDPPLAFGIKRKFLLIDTNNERRVKLQACNKITWLSV